MSVVIIAALTKYVRIRLTKNQAYINIINCRWSKVFDHAFGKIREGFEKSLKSLALRLTYRLASV